MGQWQLNYVPIIFRIFYPKKSLHRIMLLEALRPHCSHEKQFPAITKR